MWTSALALILYREKFLMNDKCLMPGQSVGPDILLSEVLVHSKISRAVEGICDKSTFPGQMWQQHYRVSRLLVMLKQLIMWWKLNPLRRWMHFWIWSRKGYLVDDVHYLFQQINVTTFNDKNKKVPCLIC